MCRKLLALAVAFGILLLTPGAAAEPLHTHSIAQCVTAEGSEFTIPPAYILPEPEWDSLDLRMRKLQESETRLKAENKVLSRPEPMPWKIITGALIIGIGAGAYMFRD